jgi:uncharacterized tellurite resistance protein B-like protein
MHILMTLAMILLMVAIIHHLFKGPGVIPRATGGWGAGKTDDPRVAMAAMMYAVAAEDGRVTEAREQQIVALLMSTVGLEPSVARDCLKAGRRFASLDGDLTSRLHQLKEPIANTCSHQEKQDVIEALRKVAGPSGEQIGSVRDGIGRLAASLLHN